MDLEWRGEGTHKVVPLRGHPDLLACTTNAEVGMGGDWAPGKDCLHSLVLGCTAPGVGFSPGTVFKLV